MDADGNAYIVGTTSSANFPVANAFQSTLSAFSDVFVSKLNASGSAFIYSTYLGGTGTDQGRAIAIRAGAAYVVGITNSSNFPLANAFKSTLDTFDTDAFVTKLNPSGSALDFSTYLGGENFDQAFGVAVDVGGNAYVTGSTSSFLFPSLNGPQFNLSNGTNAFVTKFNSSGTSLI